MSTTQTGVPIINCKLCGREHPVHTQHCTDCGRPTRFIQAGICLTCLKENP